MISSTEVCGLISAVSKSMITLRHEILMIVDSSAEPLCCADIYDKSKQGMDTRSISIEVSQMTRQSGLLEVARKEKPANFREIAFYRITDLGREQLRQLNAEIASPATNMKQKTSEVKPIAAEPDQEKTMIEKTVKRRGGGTPSPLNLAIYNKVVASPGINIPKLIRHALDEMPEENAMHIRKTIDNMVRVTKKLRSEGSGDDRTLHLNVTGLDVQPSTPVKQKPAVKINAAALLGDTKPAASAEPAKPEHPVIQPDKQSEFSLMISDENCLYISIDDQEIRLNPMQLSRLNNFLGRCLPDGVRLTDGAIA
jgi:hypothetical protein